jgi:predicted AlkP superfamily pyrophosphatase or phosphodiesterase
MEWTDTVLRDYVLPELAPDVIVDWMGPLDAAQHDHGVSSPEAKRALAAIDRSLARTLAAMQALTPARRVDVVITSDHGFAAHASGVNVVQALIGAGLKASATSTDVIVASQSQAVLFYVPNHDPEVVSRLVRFLQQQPWVDVVFTRAGTNGQGAVAGTLSFDITKGSHPSRAPDVAASLSWTSSRNAFGVPGAQTIHSTTGGASRPPGSPGPITSGASGHGGLSPWVVRNTLVLWGHDFKSRARVNAPASLADLMPTVLKVLSVDAERCDSGCGRVLEEALRMLPERRAAPGPDRRPTPSQRTVTTASGAYRASVRISSVGGHDYVDQGSRER